MQTEDGYVDPADLLYLRIDNDDDMIDDEDD